MNLFEQLAQATKPTVLDKQMLTHAEMVNIGDYSSHTNYIKALVKRYKNKRLTSLN